MRADWTKANAAYHNGKKSGLTDAEFDKLEAAIRKLDPKWTPLKATGAEVMGGKKRKVTLVEPMPSLDKFYPIAVNKRLDRGPQLVMNKLDGSALQLVARGGKMVSAVTRGNGLIGQDISFLLPQMKLPKSIPAKGQVVFRCEAVMKDAVFAKKYAAKYDNARNLVAGVLNRKSDGTPDPILKDIDIVVLGVYGLEMFTGLQKAKKWGFDVVVHAVMRTLSADVLTARLEKRKSESEYEIDGLVLCSVGWELSYANNDRPKDIWAFKVNTDDETFDVLCEDILFQVSSHSRINIRAKLKPTRIGGVTVTHATLHNATWMTSRKIGPGAVLKVVRSGGVIPKIVGVAVPAKKAKLPSIPYVLKGRFFWVDKKADVGSDVTDRIQTLKIAKFMTVMGVDLLAGKTIEKLLPQFPDVQTYLNMWSAGVLAFGLRKSGLGEKTAHNIVAEFDKVFRGKAVSMRKLLVASSIFKAGMGDRKLTQLEDAGISMQDLMKQLSGEGRTAVQLKVIDVKGFSDKTADLVVNGLAKFRPMLFKYRKVMKIDGDLAKKAAPVKGGALSGQVVSFTSYRDKAHEDAIATAGGTVASLGAKTTILLFKDGGVKFPDKLDKARATGIRVCTFKELKL